MNTIKRKIKIPNIFVDCDRLSAPQERKGPEQVRILLGEPVSDKKHNQRQEEMSREVTKEGHSLDLSKRQ
jgi:hypothetical protein